MGPVLFDILPYMARVLGLDVSSSTVGWAIIDYDDKSIKLVDSGFIKPSKKVSIFVSLSKLKKDIIGLIDKFKPDDVAIENIVEFMASKSSSKTIIALSVYNRTVGLACFEKTNKEPNLYSVMTIRHKIKLTKQLPKKEDIPSILEHHLKIKFPYHYNKNKKVIIENFDMADGIAVALCHVFTIKNKK